MPRPVTMPTASELACINHSHFKERMLGDFEMLLQAAARCEESTGNDSAILVGARTTVLQLVQAASSVVKQLQRRAEESAQAAQGVTPILQLQTLAESKHGGDPSSAAACNSESGEPVQADSADDILNADTTLNAAAREALQTSFAALLDNPVLSFGQHSGAVRGVLVNLIFTATALTIDLATLPSERMPPVTPNRQGERMQHVVSRIRANLTQSFTPL